MSLPPVVSQETLADGSVLIRIPDKHTTLLRRRDGSKLQTDTKTGTTIETSPRGTTKTQRNPNGVVIVSHADGRVVQTGADGAVLDRAPDGSSVETYPDGARVETAADGTATKTLPDGMVQILHPDGRQEQHHPDGRRMVVHPDGRRVQSNVDGSSIEVDASGTQTLRSSDGYAVQVTRAGGAGGADALSNDLRTVSEPKVQQGKGKGNGSNSVVGSGLAAAKAMRTSVPHVDTSMTGKHGANGRPWGVSLRALQYLSAASSSAEDMTTAGVCEHVVKPLTASAEASLVGWLQTASDEELLKACDGALSAADVGPAGIFVSHAWRYPFASVVETLEQFCAGESASDAAMRAASSSPPSPGGAGVSLFPFFWFDIATVNQHQASDKSPEWWRSEFRNGIRRIGHTLLVMHPWRDPVPLTRSWCLWELLCSSETARDTPQSNGDDDGDGDGEQCKLEIALPPGEKKAFADALVLEFSAVEQIMMNIDGMRAEAYVKSDEECIRAAVAATEGGFVALNTRVKNLLRAWLAQVGTETFEREKKKALQNAVDESERQALAFMAQQVGRLHLDQGRAVEAESLLRQALADLEQLASVGTEHHRSALCMSYLSDALRHQGKDDEALDLCRRAVQVFTRVDGPEHSSTLAASGNMAILSLNQARKRRAALQQAAARGAATADKLAAATAEAEQAAAAAGEGAGDGAAAAAAAAAAPAAEGTEALAFIEERAEVAAVERLLKEAEDHFRRLVKVHAAELATAQAKAADSAETHEAQRALMTSYNNLAQVSAERGQKEDAMRTLKKVLATLEELPGYGKKHKDTLRCRTNLGTLLSELAVEGADATARAAAFDEADQVLTAASKGLAETLGPAHTSTVTTLHNLGYMLYNRARSDDLKEDRAGAEKLLARSERLFQQTYEGWTGLKGAAHADAVQALTHAAGCAVLLGKPVEGRTALEAWIQEHAAAADAVAQGIVERALAGVTARIAVEDTQKKQGRMQ